MTRRTPATVVERMLRTGALEAVVADPAEADRALDASAQHIASARLIATADPVGAYQLVYDAARKALAAILLANGLRATARGGHVAVIDATGEIVPLSPAQVRMLHGMRRIRNQAEYGNEPVGRADVDDAIRVAADLVPLARRALNR